VQIGQAVGQAGAQVQQRGSRLAGDARVAVGRAGDHAFKQTEHAAHLRLAVQRGHKVHLRRTGVGKAHIHPVGQQGVTQLIGTVHLCFLSNP
jgi:hypothetical protein